MRHLECVIATNQITRKNTVLTDEALEDGARQINDLGGIPQLHCHDWTRLVGWTSHARTKRDGDMVSLVAVMEIPESQDEYKAISQKYSDYCCAKHRIQTGPCISSADERFPKARLLTDLSCVYSSDKDISFDTYPALKKKVNDDGLFVLDRDSKFVGDGLIEFGEDLLVPHCGFRPSYSLPNILNREFFGVLSSIPLKHPDMRVSLRLDHNLLGIRKSLANYEQMDYWWGPKYKGDSKQIARGVSVHGPTKYDEIFGRLRQTEFWWYGKELLTFEIEEVLKLPVEINTEYGKLTGMRFIHSIFDKDTGRPCHLDGALRLYDDELLRKRWGKTIDKFGKNAIRLKMWRVDGDIPFELWYELIHNYFRDNYTVPEYFGHTIKDHN